MKPPADPAREFAAAQVKEHDAAMGALKARIATMEEQAASLFDEKATLDAQYRESQKLRDQAQAFLDAAALPAPAPVPRTKRGLKDEKILASLVGVMDVGALAQVTGFPRDLLHEPLRRLVKAGKIVAEGKAFRLPEQFHAVTVTNGVDGFLVGRAAQ